MSLTAGFTAQETIILFQLVYALRDVTVQEELILHASFPIHRGPSLAKARQHLYHVLKAHFNRYVQQRLELSQKHVH